MLERHAQNFYRWWNDVIWTPGLPSKEPGQEAMPQCKWQMSDDLIDRSIDQKIHQTSMFTVGQKFYRWWNDVIWTLGLQGKSLGRRLCPNASAKCQMVRLIDRIQQTSCLRSDKYFTDGEMTLFSKLGLPKVKSLGRSMPQCKWQMSDGPINLFKNANHCFLNTLDFKPTLHWIAYPRPYRFELLEG
jgi:hypothetical protein